MGNDMAGIHEYLIERYPMYRTESAFEEWLGSRSAGDRGRLDEYLGLLEDYGFIDGEGRVGKDFNTVPDPARVVDEITSRIDGVAPDVLRTLQCAAVEGAEFSTSAVTALAEGDVSASLAAAEQAGLVRRIGEENIYASPTTRYRFVPRKAQEVIYAALPEDERARLHALFIQFLSTQLDRTTEPGAREMLSRLISEQNRRVMRPEPKESPKSPEETKSGEIRS
jgi:hypothetical protein